MWNGTQLWSSYNQARPCCWYEPHARTCSSCTLTSLACGRYSFTKLICPEDTASRTSSICCWHEPKTCTHFKSALETRTSRFDAIALWVHLFQTQNIAVIYRCNIAKVTETQHVRIALCYMKYLCMYVLASIFRTTTTNSYILCLECVFYAESPTNAVKSSITSDPGVRKAFAQHADNPRHCPGPRNRRHCATEAGYTWS